MQIDNLSKQSGIGAAHDIHVELLLNDGPGFAIAVQCNILWHDIDLM